MPKPSLVLMFVNMMTYFRRRLPAALAHSRVGGADAAPESIRHRAEQGRARGTRSQGAEVYAPYPIKMSESPSDVKRSPLLGEHTDEVLGELGYGADQIAALRTEKVI